MCFDERNPIEITGKGTDRALRASHSESLGLVLHREGLSVRAAETFRWVARELGHAAKKGLILVVGDRSSAIGRLDLCIDRIRTRRCRPSSRRVQVMSGKCDVEVRFCSFNGLSGRGCCPF
jgi:hypothetical protein